MEPTTKTKTPGTPSYTLPSKFSSEVTMDSVESRLRQIEQHYSLPSNHFAWAIGNPSLIFNPSWAGSNGNTMTGTIGIVTAGEGNSRSVVATGASMETGSVFNEMFQNLANTLPLYMTQYSSGQGTRRAA